MKHITKWEIEEFSSPNLNLYTDEKSISLVKPHRNGTFDILASLEYEYKDNGTLIINSSDSYLWKLEADIDREVLTLDLKNPELNKLWK
ncbi:hypothetical protein AB4G91_01355 [Macrococcoides goetzii]|uniref:hypothetical protein n=1 Tax=Macrococcus sp. PK TaxID=2801919 RepID=UPI001F104BC2|nr:hypothetical protein [Macrococcus sp. PK]MCH4983943.1 hypothetical protein [Macrococcus sp. PK]